MTAVMTPTRAIETAVAGSSSVQHEIDRYIEQLYERLFDINRQIHQNPETALQEVHAHDTICDFLEANGFQVTRHAYGMATSFEARFGLGGRCVNFNAEYDALPDVGHACGHNLIATAGSACLLGTPAEEDVGGKLMLLDAGAFKHVDVSLMIHPMSEDDYKDQGVIGAAGQTSIANVDLTCDYHGKSAHASGNPWNGVNALDALVAAYTNVSLLRQQISPDERIHGCILDAPKVTNVIPEFTRLKYSARSPTLDRVRRLAQRIRSCVEAGALATGCHVDVSTSPAYADFRVNAPLSGLFKSEMSSAYHEEVLERQSEPMKGSTDQGNVSYAVPALHAIVGIPTAQGSHPHDRDFTAAAGTKEAHARAVLAGKVMALCGWKILTDNRVYEEIKAAFEADRKQRPRI